MSFNDMLERIGDGFRRLSNFSADIAHELRTPITNLTTQTHVALSQARTTEEYREILYSSQEELDRMSKMVGDMLFIARADNKQLSYETEDLEVGAEVRALFEFFEAFAEERGVNLVVEGGPAIVRANQSMMRRALSNLLSNAIRRTPSNHTVIVRLGAGDGLVSIRVCNPGRPIEPEHLPKLFDRFYRVDPSRQRNGDGAGLGLAIVKSIVDAHGGSVSASSSKGEVIFTMNFPASLHQGIDTKA